MFYLFKKINSYNEEELVYYVLLEKREISIYLKNKKIILLKKLI